MYAHVVNTVHTYMVWLTFPDGSIFQLSLLLSSENPAASSLFLHSATTAAKPSSAPYTY